MLGKRKQVREDFLTSLSTQSLDANPGGPDHPSYENTDGARYRTSSKPGRDRSATWIAKFNKKTCIFFVPDSKKPSRCCCGRPTEQHGPIPLPHDIAERHKNEVWDKNKYLKCKPTNAFGEIEFKGTGRKSRAKYIRVADDTDAQLALRLLLKEWKLEFPKLLISVTGGAKTFKLPDKLKQLFRQGLFKVAETTGAWVITGGTNTGVMKHVGEALQGASKSSTGSENRNRVHCIGIATWGIVDHREHLIDSENKTVQYHMTSSMVSQGACLDNNHTHFLLVDDGTVGKYGAEIEFRARLEKCMMDPNILTTVDKNRGENGVPAVQLVLEGGPNTIKTMYEAISQKPPIPVVVIKDSGRAADLIAYAYNIKQVEGPMYDLGDVVEHAELLKRIGMAYPGMKEEQWLVVYKDILKCVENKEFITIFRMEEGTADIDHAILQALLKSKSTKPQEQLRLALLWNRADIAKSEIFHENLKWRLQDLERAMKDALSYDRVEFVELLLDRGINMSDFLSVEKLESLYNIRARKGKSMLKYIVDTERENKNSISMTDVSKAYAKLTGIELRQRCSKGEKVSLGLYNTLKPGVGWVCHFTELPFHDPYNMLFIWAVLNNMQQMALLFWKHGDEAMAKSLIACKLYHALHNIADKRDVQDDIIDSLDKHRKEFQDISYRLLDESFQVDEGRTGKLLTYNLANWGFQTCLSLAVSARHETFVAHSCIQALLEDMWVGAMHFKTSQSIKVVGAILFPPLVMTFGFRSLLELRQMPKTEEEHDDDVEEVAKEREAEIDDKNTKGQLSSTKREDMQVNTSFDATESHVSFKMTSPSQKDVCSISPSDNIREPQLNWWQKYGEFYRSPIAKFWSNVLMYLVFLGLFSFVVLVQMQEKPSIQEWILIAFVISLTTEEIRQFLHTDAPEFKKKLKEWASSNWNLCDAVAICLFFVGLGLRFSPDSNVRSAGHVVYSLDIMLWIIRLLDIFSVNKHLGPYVVMIGRMTIDMLYFLFILAVFLLAYGVARQAILNPNEKASLKILREVFFAPYFQTYGEMFMETTNSANQTYFGTKKYDDHGEPIVALIMAFYLLVANILLLNLLIAIFNNTFSEVQANSNQIWKYERYNLITEYAKRPFLVPPFIVINHVNMFFRSIMRRPQKCRCCHKHQSSGSKTSDRKLKFFPKPQELHDLMIFEEECLANYIRKKDGLQLASQEEKIRIISERVDTIGLKLNETDKGAWAREKKLKTSVKRMETKLESIQKSLTEALSLLHGERLHTFEQQMSVPLNPEPTDSLVHSEAPYNISNDRRRTLPCLNQPTGLRKKILSKQYSLGQSQPERTPFISKATQQWRRHSLKNTSAIRSYTRDESNSPSAKEQLDTLPTLNSIDTDDATEENDLSQIHFEDQSILKPRGSITRMPSFDLSNEGSLSLKYSVHFQARQSPYLMSNIERQSVPEMFVTWTVEFPDYNPPDFTSSTVCAELKWADPTSSDSIKFNEMDGEIDRQSFCGEYDVLDGIPRNPMGRTGLTGRGLLGRWGPNHASDPIITRWKKSITGGNYKRATKDVLEFLSVKRKEEWALPGGMLEPGNELPEVVHQALGLSKRGTSIISSTSEERIHEFIEGGYMIYCGYVDDPRNTDNAWMETRVISYHDETGEVTKELKLTGTSLAWQELSSQTGTPLYSNHVEYLRRVAQLKNAAYFAADRRSVSFSQTNY